MDISAQRTRYERIGEVHTNFIAPAAPPACSCVANQTNFFTVAVKSPCSIRTYLLSRRPDTRPLSDTTPRAHWTPLSNNI